MTQKANPSINRPAEAFKTAGAIAYGGHATEGFIVPSNNPTVLAKEDDDIVVDGLSAFSATTSSISLEVSISGGEAFVFGSWLCKDTETSNIQLPSNSSTTVYVGWNKDGSNDIIIGKVSDFNTSESTDEKIPLYTFTTDSSGVIDTIDERDIGQTLSANGRVSLSTSDNVTISFDESADNIDIEGADLISNGVKVVDESQGHIPQSSLSNDSITISGGPFVSGGGSASLGDSISLNVSNQFVELNGDTMTGPLTLGGNLSATTGEIIWDETNRYIPKSSLENNSITVNTGDNLTGGESISLGQSINIEHEDTSSATDVSANSGSAVTEVLIDGDGHVTSLSTTSLDSYSDQDAIDAVASRASSGISFEGVGDKLLKVDISDDGNLQFLENGNELAINLTDLTKSLPFREPFDDVMKIGDGVKIKDTSTSPSTTLAEITENGDLKLKGTVKDNSI
jgi:hypothetical protein